MKEAEFNLYDDNRERPFIIPYTKWLLLIGAQGDDSWGNSTSERLQARAVPPESVRPERKSTAYLSFGFNGSKLFLPGFS